MRTGRYLFLLSLLSLLGIQANAMPPPGAKARHADRNKDGVVTRREMRKEKRWEQHQKSKVNKPWEYKADVNNDGVVEPAEKRLLYKKKADANNDGVIDTTENVVFWSAWRNKVNTPLEARFDANKDGWLDWTESKALLSDRLAVIDINGQVHIDSDIERLFDTDGNDIIDTNEAVSIRKAID